MIADLAFPQYNIYSMPLLILVLQAYVFSVLLLIRYLKKRQKADLFLALLLFIGGFARTMYIIGFMSWYDTYPNTKVNYFILDVTLLFGPFIYFYVKSITVPNYLLKKRDWWHFLPFLLYASFMIVMYVHDVQQPGFDEVQNGVWLSGIAYKYVYPFYWTLSEVGLLIYLIFASILFYNYRQKIKEYFSNTYKVQLTWLRNFLAVMAFAFVFSFVTDQINNNIIDLQWTGRWWSHLVTALALVYLGAFGYFTDLSELYSLTIETPNQKDFEAIQPLKTATKTEIKQDFKTEKERLQRVMQNDQPYLSPDLTLSVFSRLVNLPSQQLSLVINNGFGMNFKDFINSYRVKAVQEAIQSGKAKQLSLLGIAYECGFNSKATFNRTFRKFTNQSPSEYLRKVNQEASIVKD